MRHRVISTEGHGARRQVVEPILAIQLGTIELLQLAMELRDGRHAAIDKIILRILAQTRMRNWCEFFPKSRCKKLNTAA